MERSAKNLARNKVLVPHFEMVEAELPTASEEKELLASLQESEEQFRRGEFEIYKKGELLQQFRSYLVNKK
jgi:hypothetical protein